MDHVTARGNERRAIFRAYADLTQRQVARVLDLGSGSTVSKQLRELARRLASDRDLRNTMAAISEDLTSMEAKASFNA